MSEISRPWLKNYPKNIKWDENIQPKPVFQLLTEAAKNFPSRPAIDFFGKTTNYVTLNLISEQVAYSLVKDGLVKGTKIGIFMPNCPQFIAVYFGILKAGGVVVNCSPLYSESELEHQLEDSDTEILFTVDLALLYPKAKSILQKSLEKNRKLKKVIVGDFASVISFPKNLLFKIFKAKDLSKIDETPNIVSLKKFIELGKLAPAGFSVDVDVDDTAIIQYTGGTTGVPKGAELTHRNVYINAIQSKLWCKHTEDGTAKILIVLPLFHVFAMTTGMLFGISTAAKLILHPRFDIKAVLEDLNNKKPTAMPGVATMFNAINNYPQLKKYNLKSLKICVSGGGPLPAEIKQKFEAQTGCNLIEGYGLTEASPVVSCNPVGTISKAGSIGLPFPDTEILIEDMENRGSFLEAGKVGELCIRGPQVMKGYYKKPRETQEVLRDNILRTGDVAMFDEDGFVFIVDRIKEMIISGGFKIYPRNVEEIIYRHPAVLECAVIGIPDEYSGQKVKAFVVLKKSQTATSEELMEFFRKNLAKHEVPKILEFKDALPKSPVGKILKKELS